MKELENMNCELISFDHHKNGVALYKYSDEYTSFYKKKSFSALSNRTISTEYGGYSWFFSQLDIENEVIISKNSFYELLIPKFSGNNIKSTSRLNGNEKYIELILEFYIKIWDQNSKLKVHGDFALGNFIFDTDFIYLIDWEHYHESDEHYWGFDFFHLLFLALQAQAFRITPKTKSFLKLCYKIICDSASNSNKIMDKPFQNSNIYMKEYSGRFGLSIPIENKFEMASISQSILKKLDMAIT